MLPTSSPPADSAAPLNVFQRAKARLRIGNSRNETGPAAATTARRPLPVGAQAKRVQTSSRPINTQAALAATATPQVLLEKFHELTGGEKTAFFRANKTALFAAEAAARLALPPPIRRAMLTEPPARPAAAATPIQAAGETPEALLEKFHGMEGIEKTAFFRANHSLLKVAAAVVGARESADEDQAARNFSVALAEATPALSGAPLLERFNSLSGAVKTAFFRANHTALKIAAANETR